MLKYADEAWSEAIDTKGSVENLFYDYNKFEYVDNGFVSVPGTDPETDFELSYENGADGSFNKPNNREVLLYRYAPSMSRYAYASQEFVSIFSDEDLRKELFILKDVGFSKGDLNDGIVKKYFRAEKIGLGNTTGFSYPELLLMRAEAYVRNNQDANALADLNTLREYRYKTGTPVLSGLTGDDLLNEILNERRRELPTPSYKRFIDLKRFAAYDEGKPWAKTTVTKHLMTYTAVQEGEPPLAPVQSGTSFSAPVDSESFILPIPNTVLIHNPHWGIPLAPEDYNPS